MRCVFLGDFCTWLVGAMEGCRVGRDDLCECFSCWDLWVGVGIGDVVGLGCGFVRGVLFVVGSWRVRGGEGRGVVWDGGIGVLDDW